jgi:hypothetical protein
MNYEAELRKIFSKCTRECRDDPSKELNIRKITLVYDLEELEEKEKEIKRLVKNK